MWQQVSRGWKVLVHGMHVWCMCTAPAHAYAPLELHVRQPGVNASVHAFFVCTCVEGRGGEAERLWHEWHISCMQLVCLLYCSRHCVRARYDEQPCMSSVAAASRERHDQRPIKRAEAHSMSAWEVDLPRRLARGSRQRSFRKIITNLPAQHLRRSPRHVRGGGIHVKKIGTLWHRVSCLGEALACCEVWAEVWGAPHLLPSSRVCQHNLDNFSCHYWMLGLVLAIRHLICL